MGILCDYFRATDVASVAKLMEATKGDSPVTSATADGVDVKGIEPNVMLGKLVAMILDVEWHTDISGGNLAWPAEGEADRAYEGPWVQAIHERARDALAGLDDERVPELAKRWAGIEELAVADCQEAVEGLREAAAGLVFLARRARAAGDQLYCWFSL